VDIGTVTAIDVSPDLDHVVVTAELRHGSEQFLAADSRFWVARPRITASQVSGLETLLSGAFVAVDPGGSKQQRRHFQGLADPPVITTDAPGRRYRLRSDALGSLNFEAVGSAIEEDVAHRTAEIVEQVRALVRTAESYLPQPYSAEGFYRLFRAGAFAVPDLWEGREEFAAAASQRTRVIGGRVAVVGDSGAPLPVEERVGRLRRALRETAVL